MCPIYEFECKQCKKVEEELCPIDTQSHSVGCLTCLSPMIRITSAANGFVQGGISNKVSINNKTKSSTVSNGMTRVKGLKEINKNKGLL
jgi:predicted nucleic acid-binding Zn ribbon protein